jgi:hypothetical protein
LNWVLLCAAGLSSGWGCSDDGGGAASARFETLPDQGGSAGAASNQTGSSGTGAATGSGGSEGGNVAPGLAGTGAASGEGRTADAGLSPVTRGDAGPVDAGAAPAEDPAAEPDAEAPPVPPEPEPETPPAQPPTPESVAFGDVFPILVASCGGCHGANAPGNRPRFAQTGNQAASFTATQGMSGGGVVSARIIARAVTTRDMPPACGRNALGTGACLDVAEGALLQAWLTQGAQQ